jgi:phospholipid N-methyltransferase
LKKFPYHKDSIYNTDILFLEKLFDEHNINKVDLVISGLPFRSLPKEVFSFVTDVIFVKYLTKESKFIQFSYFKSTIRKLHKYFADIDTEICLLNLPIAYVFTCNNYKK